MKALQYDKILGESELQQLAQIVSPNDLAVLPLVYYFLLIIDRWLGRERRVLRRLLNAVGKRGVERRQYCV